MNLQESRDWIADQATRVSEFWFQAQCLLPTANFHLYFQSGALEIFEGFETPDGWELATPQRISPMWTQIQARQFVINTAQKLPCLPTEDA